ncbi:MAG: flagellar basal body L-ring protein FlgH [Planctomycetota bacterium]|jgi:flagellar L-ring protein precursor FlgH
MTTRHAAFSTGLLLLSIAATPAAGQTHGTAPAASGSLLERALNGAAHGSAAAGSARSDTADAYSMLRVPLPGPREFAKHDLVQIIVRESSASHSKHELDAEKEYDIDGRIKAWPHFDIVDMLQLQLAAGNTSPLPELSAEFSKNFEGDGEYKRRDDLTARLTAEVVEVLPNGNLVLEARTQITNDDEGAIMTMTGICRSDDVSAANSVLSSQVFNLKFEKVHTGELKKANQKGIITKIFDFFFAW